MCLYPTPNYTPPPSTHLKRERSHLFCLLPLSCGLSPEAGGGRRPELLPDGDQTDGGEVHRDPGVHREGAEAAPGPRTFTRQTLSDGVLSWNLSQVFSSIVVT